MTDVQWWRLFCAKWDEQAGRCPVCGEHISLEFQKWPRPQLAHRIKRSRVVRELGTRYEWDTRVLWLTHPACNQGALIGEAHRIEQDELLDEICKEDGIL